MAGLRDLRLVKWFSLWQENFRICQLGPQGLHLSQNVPDGTAGHLSRAVETTRLDHHGGDRLRRAIQTSVQCGGGNRKAGVAGRARLAAAGLEDNFAGGEGGASPTDGAGAWWGAGPLGSTAAAGLEGGRGAAGSNLNSRTGARPLRTDTTGLDPATAHGLEHDARGWVGIGTGRAVAGDDGIAGEVLALRDWGPSRKGGGPWRALDRVVLGEVAHGVNFTPTVGHAWGQITVGRATHHLVAAIGFLDRGDGRTGLARGAAVATGHALKPSRATRAVLLHHYHYRPLPARDGMRARDVGLGVCDDGTPTAGRVGHVGATGPLVGDTARHHGAVGSVGASRLDGA